MAKRGQQTTAPADRQGPAKKVDGRGGRRPGSGVKLGSKWKRTLEKEAIRELVRLHLTEHLVPILDAQVKKALGTSYLMVRDKGTGQFKRVAKSHAEKLKPREEIIEVWESDPSTQAAQELLNRAIDKPAEPLQQVQVDHEHTIRWKTKDEE